MHTRIVRIYVHQLASTTSLPPDWLQAAPNITHQHRSIAQRVQRTGLLLRCVAIHIYSQQHEHNSSSIAGVREQAKPSKRAN